MKLKIMIISFMMLVMAVAESRAAEFKGWCVKVFEGDTITVYVNKKMLTVRLAFIDCPEKGQPFFTEATEFTSNLILKKKIDVLIETYTGSEFLVGRVILDDKDLSMLLIEAGLAWYYKGHGNDRYLSKAFRKAKKKKAGIWSEKNPVPPWEFRGEKGGSPDDSE